MTLYFGNDEVSQKVLLSTVGSNLPEITTETSGKILSNNGTELEWVDKPSGKIIGSFGYTLDEVAPDGCVFCDGSEYEKAKFPDFYQSLVDNKRKSVDYATFNSSVSTNGSCGFFGLDTENEKFKVPMLKDVYLKAGQEPVIFGGESLPNITGTAATDAFTLNNLEPTGAFYKADMSYLGRASETNTQPNGLGFNASLSSPTYQDGAKVNPDYVAYKVFVVIYNAETEISESQTSEFLNTVNEINNKLDNQKTNCITKIPQNIKLELSEDGVLTLKAGSKVYIPNGFEEDGTTPKFDEVVIESDKTYAGTFNGTLALFYTPTLSTLNGALISILGSGTSVPTTGDSIYYKTDTNTLAHYKSGALQNYRSFPLASFTISNNTITSIDQVFNGFGYIGNTVFALPGIEGLIPNGRNDDGSLNNIKFTTADVLLSDKKSNWTQNQIQLITANSLSGAADYDLYYDEILNYNIFNEVTKSITCIWGTANLINGSVSSFNPKNTFQFIDINNTEWASLSGKPSNKTKTLTLEASGSEFTVPTNGWLFCNVTITSDTAHNNALTISNKTSNLSVRSIDSNTTSTIGHNLYVPCKKGDIISIVYTGTLVGHNLKFIYDEGSK